MILERWFNMYACIDVYACIYTQTGARSRITFILLRHKILYRKIIQCISVL